MESFFYMIKIKIIYGGKMLEKNKIYLGDNVELLKQLDNESINSVVSDFPYNLSFMGKKWDTISNYYDWCYERAIELLRVLKIGGYCLIFGGTRTHHRLVCAFEDAGFVIKDEIAWMYGSGMPKGYNISKGFDKQANVERKIIGNKPKGWGGLHNNDRLNDDNWNKIGTTYENGIPITAPSTNLAKQWDGWNTSLKPAHEPIMVAQKPIEKNYCYNVEKHGVGGLNIDDSRISHNELLKTTQRYGRKNAIVMTENTCGFDNTKNSIASANPQGRFPANVILDEEAGKMLDEQSGELKSGTVKPEGFKGKYSAKVYGKYAYNQIDPNTVYGDKGGASRFFYCPKSSKKDKTENGQVENTHPTVKPTDLIKYLIRLVTPPNGISLDICEGSGTHSKACILLTKEDYLVNYIGFENDEESFNIAQQRIDINYGEILLRKEV